MAPRNVRSKMPAPAMHGSLLDEAKDLFARRGYVGTSLRDLAEASGVTAAAVYYHFSKKEDLLKAIVFDGLERLSHSIIHALAGSGTPRERLEALVRAHLSYNVEFPRESRIIIEDSRFLNAIDFAAAREKQMAILYAYRACISQIAETGEIAPVNPNLAAFGIIGVIGAWYRWYREDGPVSKDEAFEYMVQFALAGALRPTAAG